MVYLHTLGEKWSHSMGNRLVNIPYMDPMAVKQWEWDEPKLCETVDDQQRDQTLSPLNVTRLLPFE